MALPGVRSSHYTLFCRIQLAPCPCNITFDCDGEDDGYYVIEDDCIPESDECRYVTECENDEGGEILACPSGTSAAYSGNP